MKESNRLNVGRGEGAKAVTEEDGAPRTKHDGPPLSEGEMACAVHAPCFVVGIGASAGGQVPLEHIFTAVPSDCNLAYVVIMHLPAEGPSYLADLLRRYTPMVVKTAEDDSPLLPNTVHVIPPGAELTISCGRLRVNSRTASAASLNHPIDRFLTSLAADCGERAIALILSGFGMDGVEGVKRIKESGGIVLVQDPESAVNSPMPANAVATGVADLVLTTEEIPVKFAEIARGYCDLTRKACRTSTIDEEFQAIFDLVKTRTGNDFSSYKRNTVLRRIERRMTVNESGGLRKYIALLEKNPREAEALAQEILIGVTRFFRDTEAFDVLKSEVIPRIFANRDPDDPVRIWNACCATGEEAYSVAMLVREHLEKERLHNRVQIFATDIDEAAIAEARAGFYAEEITADVGDERLMNFFARCNGRRQVVKELREMILFAGHNIIKDPPFSRLDLLVCRNFLIYLNPDMQKRLIALFHMVLKPGGFLFLGSAETAGNNTDLFTPLDKKWKIYQRLEGARREEALFPFTAPIRKLTRQAISRPDAGADEPTPAVVADKVLVKRFSPPCVVVNENYEVLYISSRTSPYLELPVGAPAMDILKMAREELRPALRAAIYKAFTENRQMVFRGVKLADDEDESLVNVMAEPLAAHPSYGKLALVVLQPAPPPAHPHHSSSEGIPGDDSSGEVLINQLEEQLRITHEQLRLATEQLETSNEGFMATNEELMSINEEFQSANEELQSTNEELEASKEELQALNEELVTVNAELQGKVEELDQANSDMENLFASSDIATIFLDGNLTIKRFSPAMAVIFNLIPADIGRPFRHLAGTINWSGLTDDAQRVLEKLVPVEREVNALEDGRCFIMRVLPYRTMEGKVGGIVVTLVDITERKKAEIKISNLAAIVENAEDAIIGKDLQGIVQNWNAGAENIFGYSAAEMIGKSLAVLIPPGHVDEVPDIIKRIQQGEHIRRFETERMRKDGKIIQVSLTFSPIKDAAGTIIGVSKTAHDITERKHTEEELRRHVEEMERFNLVSVGRELRMVELKKEVNELCARLSEPPRYPLEFEE